MCRRWNRIVEWRAYDRKGNRQDASEETAHALHAHVRSHTWDLHKDLTCSYQGAFRWPAPSKRGGGLLSYARTWHATSPCTPQAFQPSQHVEQEWPFVLLNAACMGRYLTAAVKVKLG